MSTSSGLDVVDAARDVCPLHQGLMLMQPETYVRFIKVHLLRQAITIIIFRNKTIGRLIPEGNLMCKICVIIFFASRVKSWYFFIKA